MRGDMFSCPIANGCLIIRGLSYLPTSWNLKELIFWIHRIKQPFSHLFVLAYEYYLLE